MKQNLKSNEPKLDKKLAAKISKELEAQYPGGFARIFIEIYFFY